MADAQSEKEDDRPILRDERGRLLPGTRAVNPAGARARRVSLADVIARQLADNPELGEQVIRSLVAKAIAGDTKATEMLLDRTDGKPLQRIVQAESVASLLRAELEAEENPPEPTA